MTEQNPNIIWLAIGRVPQLGPARLRQQLARTGDIQSVWRQLPLDQGVRGQLIESAEQEYKILQKQNIQLLSLGDNDYPDSLLSLNSAPAVVFAKGQIELLKTNTIAVVGSRQATTYGSEVTKQLVEQLVAQGWVIASGLANGIDTIAHRAALAAGGRTIAVVGYSLDYLPQHANRQLIEQMAASQRSLFISQFSLGTPAQKFTFPARNKIMAAISQAVLVTQASRQSGTLLTAQAARDYGKPVFAVPGSIFSTASQGAHSLINQGAVLAVDAAGIVKTLTGKTATDPASSPPKPGLPLTANEGIILQFLQTGPLSVDQLIRASSLAAAETAAAVSLLELKGLVRPLDNGEYCKL
jgi:DNA processing protein